MNKDIENAIRCYIRAKDDNKPHLMSCVFSEHATLEMEVRTGAIDFPSATQGRDEITKTLVRDFNKTYENIYTFCLNDTVIEKENTLDCQWFVVMSEKLSGSIRVGYGNYKWRFSNDNSYFVDKLTIVIEDVMILSSSEEGQILSWVSSLPYPCLPSSDVLNSMPGIHSLTEWPRKWSD
ncbi:hypothetical protein [Pseudoteredinibacter isoporae]|uniref:hypothetical protein n=1 Tax=Pseudoteredinibacter isoporae TaxID=570281 RepID=UPI00310B0EDF